jgi:hypothetical protein
MTPQVLKGFFTPELFRRIKAHVEYIAVSLKDAPIKDLAFNRHDVHNDPTLVKIHEHLEPWLAKHLGVEVKKSYCFLSIYRDNGICPRHTDRPQCKYTIDVCISQLQPWTIYVDDIPYLLQENDALIYSGTDSPHYRQRLQTGNHCYLVFFHFVPIDFQGDLN